MPWWKSLSILSENKGVFGLNMLAWQDHEGLDRVIEPLSKEIEAGTIEIDPVVAEAFPFDRAATPTASSPSGGTSARSSSFPRRPRSERSRLPWVMAGRSIARSLVTIEEMRPGRLLSSGTRAARGGLGRSARRRPRRAPA